MYLSKRQRPDDVDDGSDHGKKKMVNSDETRSIYQPMPTLLGSDLAQFSQPGPMDISQDASTIPADVNHPPKQMDILPDTNTCLMGAKTPLERSQCKAGGCHERRITTLENCVYTLKNSVHELQQKERIDILNLINDTRTLMNEREKLQDQLKAAQHQLKAAQDHLKAVEGQLKSANLKNLRLTEDIELIGITRQIAPDLDSTLEDQFLGLRRTVRDFARTTCDRRIPVSSLPEDLKEELETLSCLALSSFLKSGLHAKYFAEGLIWRILCKQFLEYPLSIWGSSTTINTIVEKVQKCSNLAMPSRQLWRTMTGQLLAEILEPTPSKIKCRKSFLISCLRPLVSDEHKDDIENHVMSIIQDTINLAKALARSRTLCIVQRKGLGAVDEKFQKYDSEWMDIVEKSVGYFEGIDFLVAPALVQLTNSAGDEFDPPRVIVKAEVCFGQGRTSTFTGPPLEIPPDQGVEIRRTQSGRQLHAVKRLGEVADEAQLVKLIGNDQDDPRTNPPDPVADNYIDEAMTSDD
ncbi:hypothetical protein F5Y12DRAFT_796756 [Xylaria sp. FL1777]|nr:hypothetical protein F5Y12DRAFT_796756 [Xylaria sp. FL1777]